MSDTTNLTIKIPLELKEKIKAAALETHVTLSAEVCGRLEKSFEINIAGSVPEADLIDNQHTEEQTAEAPLSHKELRKIRQLLQESNDKLKKAAKKK